MPQQGYIIDITSDDDVPPAHVHSQTQNIEATDNPSSSRNRHSDVPPRSRTLAGKTFAFRGTWLTMSTEAAEELCKANGGGVSLAITVCTQYVVIGGKGTAQNTRKLTELGASLITEADFLGMILSQSYNTSSSNLISASASASHKRPLEEETPSGLSRPSKRRKSDAKQEDEDNDMYWLQSFLMDGEIQLKGKTLAAYDCGGEIYSRSGKNVVHLLRKFNWFLEKCEGEYHDYIL